MNSRAKKFTFFSIGDNDLVTIGGLFSVTHNWNWQVERGIAFPVEGAPGLPDVGRR